MMSCPCRDYICVLRVCVCVSAVLLILSTHTLFSVFVVMYDV